MILQSLKMIPVRDPCSKNGHNFFSRKWDSGKILFLLTMIPALSGMMDPWGRHIPFFPYMVIPLKIWCHFNGKGEHPFSTVPENEEEGKWWLEKFLSEVEFEGGGVTALLSLGETLSVFIGSMFMEFTPIISLLICDITLFIVNFSNYAVLECSN